MNIPSKNDVKQFNQSSETYPLEIKKVDDPPNINDQEDKKKEIMNNLQNQVKNWKNRKTEEINLSIIKNDKNDNQLSKEE